MEKKIEQIIWDSDSYYDDKYRKAYEADTREMLDDEEYEVSDEEWSERINGDLGDERMNLDVEVNGEIIALASIGRWNGRCAGYNTFGSNVKNILSSDCDTAKWYGDTLNIRGRFAHHDGCNYALYRVAKDAETAERIGNMILCGNMDERKFCKMTKSLLPYVAKVYGWKVDGRLKEAV